jgi:hypothetical protein
MVMVGPLAGHVGVVATRKIDSLDAAHRFERLESPEDRRPADAQPAGSRFADELGRREVAGLTRDQVGKRAPRTRAPEAGVVESLKNLVRCCHRSTSIAPSRDCVSIGGP